MRRKFPAVVAVLALIAGAVYAIDGHDASYETVRLGVYYIVPEKFGKYSYEPMPDVNERCVNAWFPHDGASPCRKVKKHKVKYVDLR